MSDLSIIDSVSMDRPVDELLGQFDAYIITLARKQFPHSKYSSPVSELEVDEIVQNTRIKLWSAYQKHQVKNIKAYIRSIVYHEIVNVIRRQKVTQALSVDDEGELYQGQVLVGHGKDGEDPSYVFDQKERVAEHLSKILRAMQTFPPRQKQAVICSLREQLDDIPPSLDALIAPKVGIEVVSLPQDQAALQAMKASLSVARKKLHALLSADIREEKKPPTLTGQKTMKKDSGRNFSVDLKQQDEEFLTNAAVIDKLPEPYRTSVRLHCIEKYSYPEVAYQLELPVGTVKSHVSRGRRLLQELIEEGKTVEETFYHLEVLHEPYQTVVRLHFIEGQNYLDIATQMGTPVGTVKSQVSRGMKMLNKFSY